MQANECQAPCRFSEGCAVRCWCDDELREMHDYVDKELAAVRERIAMAKGLQEGFKTRMENMQIE